MTKRNSQPGFIEMIFISLGRGLWFLVTWPFKKIFGKKQHKFDKTTNFKKWYEIEKMLDTKDVIHAEQAIIRADKFFDAQLKHIGIQGETFADRLRNYQNHFNKNTYEQIWQAHKLRNQISHDEEHKTTLEECKSALEKFRRGLENLGAL